MFQWLHVKNQSPLTTSLLHDSAHYHVAHTGQDQLNAMKKEVLNIMHTAQTTSQAVFTALVPE
jgi:hypothetical protein